MFDQTTTDFCLNFVIKAALTTLKATVLRNLHINYAKSSKSEIKSIFINEFASSLISGKLRALCCMYHDLAFTNRSRMLE
jgi:hypothetical protein